MCAVAGTLDGLAVQGLGLDLSSSVCGGVPIYTSYTWCNNKHKAWLKEVTGRILPCHRFFC